MKIILISGKAKSGKDTFAKILQSIILQHTPSSKTIITHYADELKYIATTYYGWNGNKDETGRSLLQQIGDEIRNYNKDYFVNRLIQQIMAVSPDYLIIPDTRRNNEINNWLYRGFSVITIRINRNKDNGLTQEQKQHISECELDKYNFDYFINNNGTLNDLNSECSKLVNNWCI